MSNVRQLSDDALLQCSGHAGRNLTGLAVLATISTVAVASFAGLAAFFEPKPTALSELKLAVLVLAPFLLITAGYWLLAVAARRGNPTPVTIVMVVLSLQLIISLVGFVLAFLRSNGKSGHVALLGAIIAIFIVAALARSRMVLLELKNRGLWSERFGAARPSNNMCSIGATCLVVGCVGIYGGLFASAVSAAQCAKRISEEGKHAHAFVLLIRDEESQVVKAMQALGTTDSPDAINDVWSKLQSLEQKFASLESVTEPAEKLGSILTKYKQAIGLWKDGVAEIRKVSPNLPAAQEKLVSGDKLRQEALLEFDQKFGK